MSLSQPLYSHITKMRMNGTHSCPAAISTYTIYIGILLRYIVPCCEFQVCVLSVRVLLLFILCVAFSILLTYLRACTITSTTTHRMTSCPVILPPHRPTVYNTNRWSSLIHPSLIISLILPILSVLSSLCSHPHRNTNRPAIKACIRISRPSSSDPQYVKYRENTHLRRSTQKAETGLLTISPNLAFLTPKESHAPYRTALSIIIKHW